MSIEHTSLSSITITSTITSTDRDTAKSTVTGYADVQHTKYTMTHTNVKQTEGLNSHVTTTDSPVSIVKEQSTNVVMSTFERQTSESESTSEMRKTEHAENQLALGITASLHVTDAEDREEDLVDGFENGKNIEKTSEIDGKVTRRYETDEVDNHSTITDIENHESTDSEGHSKTSGKDRHEPHFTESPHVFGTSHKYLSALYQHNQDTTASTKNSNLHGLDKREMIEISDSVTRSTITYSRTSGETKTDKEEEITMITVSSDKELDKASNIPTSSQTPTPGSLATYFLDHDTFTRNNDQYITDTSYNNPHRSSPNEANGNFDQHFIFSSNTLSGWDGDNNGNQVTSPERSEQSTGTTSQNVTNYTPHDISTSQAINVESEKSSSPYKLVITPQDFSTKESSNSHVTETPSVLEENISFGDIKKTNKSIDESGYVFANFTNNDSVGKQTILLKGNLLEISFDKKVSIYLKCRQFIYSLILTHWLPESQKMPSPFTLPNSSPLKLEIQVEYET